ncbi:MAG TPA: hypothetical protein VGD80_06205, partial [Kofleriaceae bacterium]
IAAAPADRGNTVGGGGAFRPEMVEVVLRGVADEIGMCLAGQDVQLTAKGWARADGVVEQITVEPAGTVASCVAGVIRNAHFPPTAAGASFSHDFTGDPSAAPAQNVPPMALDGLRIKGEKNIVPDDVDKNAIQAASRSSGDPAMRLIASFKLCINREGKVSHVRILKSSGFPGYDHKIQTETMGWEYRPYLVDGKAVPVCTAITFIYTQS